MSLTEGQRRLYSGDYNNMQQEWQADGSVIITLSGKRKGVAHKLHVKDLWGEQEEVLSEEEVNTEPPEWVKRRQEESRKGS